MKRFFAMALVLAASIGITAACSQLANTNTPVSITSTESLVTGCQKVGDVAVDTQTPDVQVNMDLSDAARAKGGNYILVPAQGARTGVAYRCGMPAVASR